MGGVLGPNGAVPDPSTLLTQPLDPLPPKCTRLGQRVLGCRKRHTDSQPTLVLTSVPAISSQNSWSIWVSQHQVVKVAFLHHQGTTQHGNKGTQNGNAELPENPK